MYGRGRGGGGGGANSRGGGGGRGAYYKEKYGNKSGRGKSYNNSYHQNSDFMESKNAYASNRDDFKHDCDLDYQLKKLDRASYGAYKQCLGRWEISTNDFSASIFIDHVQADPYAHPSKFRVRVSQKDAKHPLNWMQSDIRRRGLCDYLIRRFYSLISEEKLNQESGGGGAGWHRSKGGDIRIDPPSQHVLERSSLVVNKEWVEARLRVNLPAQGRSIEGEKAARLVCYDLMDVVKRGLLGASLDHAEVWKHIQSIEDQTYARSILSNKGLVAFVRNGALLPRASGADDTVMKNGGVAFQSPQELEVTIDLPHTGAIKGMGIRKGITIIVGGGFHGKSTLLEAIQVGVYDHVPGDGREFVVTDPTAIKVRAEDGRSITGLDISPFISNLPQMKDTTNFTTADASGSTSQAANIMEALEVGCSTLIVDEDTCATNFMMRDNRMAKLVHTEPITPFLHRVRSLFNEREASTILVAGSCGDFFDVADTVIKMEEYKCQDVTSIAKQICMDIPRNNTYQISDTFPTKQSCRRVDSSCLKPKGKVKADRERGIMFGETEIDLSFVEQLVDASQTRFIMDSLVYLGDKCTGLNSVNSLLNQLEESLSSSSMSSCLDLVAPFGEPNGAYAMARKHEIAAALNRLRTLVIRR